MFDAEQVKATKFCSDSYRTVGYLITLVFVSSRKGRLIAREQGPRQILVRILGNQDLQPQEVVLSRKKVA